MPRIAVDDDDLLGEAERCLRLAEDLLKYPSTANLVSAWHHLDQAYATLEDTKTTGEAYWRERGRIDSIVADWDSACRTTALRLQVLLSLGPAVGADSSMVAWPVSAYARRTFGEVVLSSLAAGPVAGVASRRFHHLLWLPVWAMRKLNESDLLDVVRPCAPIAADRREVEVVSVLWNPTDTASPYSDIAEAFKAARALLQSPTRGELRVNVRGRQMPLP